MTDDTEKTATAPAPSKNRIVDRPRRTGGRPKQAKPARSTKVYRGEKTGTDTDYELAMDPAIGEKTRQPSSSQMGMTGQRDSPDEAPVERLTRRSRRGDTNAWDIPMHLRKPGWDYQWWTMTVHGQQVDGGDVAEIYEGGWRPAKAKDFKEILSPHWDKPTVERQGQMLYTRPMHLTMEARQEFYEKAEEQKRDKLQAAMASAGGKIGRPIVEQFQLEGEVGVHRPRQQ